MTLGEHSMDWITAIVCGLVALGAILAFGIYRNRRLRTARRIEDLLGEYFQGRMSVGQLGQRARAIASRDFFGGPTFFSLAASAFQHATDVKRAKQANSKDEDELMRLVGNLKREFGVPDRYDLEEQPGHE
ncbi:MAG: hypothetical protein WB647_08435 [Roseiarcus sp.]|uniref:hypothetical protein n=1 Tax=Roseiarcus sp. TaxID=1969460 RepID=UPI003C57F322